MDATQLRLGNLLNHGHDRICEVIGIGPKYITVKYEFGSIEEYLPNFLDGIPLTAKLLERCGFIQSENSSWMEIPDQIAVSKNGSTALFLEREWRNTKRILNFLHELQNYYKENQGTELTIKP